MERLPVNGGELEFETKGTGEPLVLIHGSISGESFDCLMDQPALTDRYQVTHYHRRGFLGSTHHTGPFSIAQQAQDALAVVQRVAGGGTLPVIPTVAQPRCSSRWTLLMPCTHLRSWSRRLL